MNPISYERYTSPLQFRGRAVVEDIFVGELPVDVDGLEAVLVTLLGRAQLVPSTIELLSAVEAFPSPN